MSDRDDRFRRLRPDGDLFAHFGIELETVAVPEPVRTHGARACSRCRWYVRTSETACPVCGQASP